MAAPEQDQRKQPTPTLISIPRELRLQIFSYVLLPTTSQVAVPLEGSRELKHFDLRLLFVSSQIHDEALSVFRSQNIFVVISTPFAEAEHWVSIHGSVPVVRTNKSGNAFPGHYLTCTIDSPRLHDLRYTTPNPFVILLEDLPAFTQHWFYTDVSNPGQNSRLRLTLHLKNPYAAAYDDEGISKRLQRRLLEPFGCIKELDEFRVHGNHYQSIEKELRDIQAVPKKTPTECLEDTTRLKDEGNKAFKEEKWDEAMRLYIDALAAMHIICEGRQRSVWGDAYFQTMIYVGQFKGQHAQQVRIVLRVTLVANVVATYLKMKEYEEARFWGMRTIDLIYDSMGHNDDAVHQFPGSEALGKIYFRTGLACIELGDKIEARRLLKIAVAYRPTDHIVSKALASVSPRLA